MTEPERTLTKLEQRLLDELLAFRATLPSAPDVGESVRAARPAACRGRRARMRRGWLERISLAAVIAAILSLAVVIVAHISSRQGALAATPTPLAYHTSAGDRSGRVLLLDLAAVAAKQPGEPANHAVYAYVKRAGWYLDTRVAGASSSSTVTATETESWTAADGSGREVTRRAGGDRSHVSATTQGPVMDQLDLRANEDEPLIPLSTNPSVLAQQLDTGHPRRIGPVERFVAFTDLANQQPIPAHVESAILRLLARSPGLIDSGVVTDRAGRPGVAVSLDSSYSGVLTRYTLILDPRTGGLLGEEETLIGNPRKLDVRSPAVLSYTVFLASGYVDTPTSEP